MKARLNNSSVSQKLDEQGVWLHMVLIKYKISIYRAPGTACEGIEHNYEMVFFMSKH